MGKEGRVSGTLDNWLSPKQELLALREISKGSESFWSCMESMDLFSGKCKLISYFMGTDTLKTIPGRSSSLRGKELSGEQELSLGLMRVHDKTSDWHWVYFIFHLSS